MRDYKKEWLDKMANEIMRQLETKDGDISGYVGFIQQKTADYFGIKKEDIVSKRRPEHIVIPRFIAIGLISTLTDLQYKVMYFFGKDRTSWYHAIEEFDILMEKTFYKKAFETLKITCSKELYEAWKDRDIINENLETYSEIQSEES